MNKTVVKMSLCAMFLALTYLLSLVHLPMPLGAGYFNLGDTALLLGAAILGPYWGALSAIAGAVFADLTLGAAMFIPFTVIAKGGEALIAGFLIHLFKNKKTYFLSFFFASIWMIIIYLFSYIILFGLGALLSSALDLIQALIATIASSLIYLIYAKYVKNDVLKLNQPFFHHKKHCREDNKNLKPAK